MYVILNFKNCFTEKDVDGQIISAFGYNYTKLSDWAAAVEDRPVLVELRGTVGYWNRKPEVNIYLNDILCLFDTINEQFEDVRFFEQVVLDFSRCGYISEIYQTLKEDFCLPDYFGNNLAALWDCLRDLPERPLSVKIIGIEQFKNKSDTHSYFVKNLFEVFDDVTEENPNVVFRSNS